MNSIYYESETVAWGFNLLSDPTIIKKDSSEYHLFFMKTGVIVLKKYESLVDYHTELTVSNRLRLEVSQTSFIIFVCRTIK